MTLSKNLGMTIKLMNCFQFQESTDNLNYVIAPGKLRFAQKTT